MRKFFLFFVSLAALTAISSCRPQIIEGSYIAKLYQVDEMFNGEVAQSIAITTTNKPFVENGVTWLQPYVSFMVLQSWGEAASRNEVHDLPIGDVEAPCNLLWEDKNGNSVFECYFYTNKNKKKEDCEWFDNFMWADIYRDSRGYLYRFGDDGTAVELSRIKNSKGQWVYWDCLRAYYKFDSLIEPDNK